ncbi:MAG TPA: hypothetical protein DEV93_14345 [Chloroflexi bacterium]|jgi:hypothetical protein|nr:hypothetical protein [Chloroflexota bacterium]
MNRRQFAHTFGLAFGTALLPARRLIAASGGSECLRAAGSRKLLDVNSRNIREAAKMGCQNMGRIFDADNQNLPYAVAPLYPRAAFGLAEFSEPQIPGRLLSALLAAEAHMGLSMDEATVKRHEQIAYLSYSGPVALPLSCEVPQIDLFDVSQIQKVDPTRLTRFQPVHVAHGFNALYALVAYRSSSRAHEIAESSIRACLDLWHPATGWNREKIEGALGLKYSDAWEEPFIAGIAMSVGPLARYYAVTKSSAALELALLIKDKLIDEYFLSAGDYDQRRLGAHTQNVVYTLASLAWLATETHDAALMERVRAFYENGVRRDLSNMFGWSPEHAGPSTGGPFFNQSAHPDMGELGNTALILETAILLARWGHREYFADAEAILRSYLLPSQIRDVSFIPESANPHGYDRLHQVGARMQGSWGYSAPYGHLPVGTSFMLTTVEVVGVVVRSLAESYLDMSRFDGSRHVVNMLFDHETADMKAESPYTNGDLRLTLKKPGSVRVRIPPWVNASDLLVNGKRDGARLAGGYLDIGPSPPGVLSITFPLTSRDVTLTWRDRKIRCRLRGDEVIAMESFGTDLTFFDPL